MRVLVLRRFAVLSYATNNIGDDIQSLAAERLLPKVDVYIDRDFISDFVPNHDDDIYLLMNGWFSHNPAKFVPHKCVIPLVTSIHISQRPYGHSAFSSPADVILKGAGLDFLRRNSPIGARDSSTLGLLRDAGIETYLAGCLTLTLTTGSTGVRDGRLLCVDLPDNILESFSARGLPFVKETHFIPPETPSDLRRIRALDLLTSYSRADCVVTSRLHAALPCVAFGTPVVLVDCAPDQERFVGLNRLVTHMSPEAFLAQVDRYGQRSWYPPVRDQHLEIAASLRELVGKFVAIGEDNSTADLTSIAKGLPSAASVASILASSLESRAQAASGTMGETRDTENILNLVRKEGMLWGRETAVTYHAAAQRDMTAQWVNIIFPVLQQFNIDYDNVLDFVAGYGRNTEMLLRLSRLITAVDVNPDCIDALKGRFSSAEVTVVQNNGIDLSMIDSESFSFIYSFDAMVHFNLRIIASYLDEFYRVARSGAFLFIHHSNFDKSPGSDFRSNPHWRNYMNVSLFKHLAMTSGFEVIYQREISWGDIPAIDGITILHKS